MRIAAFFSIVAISGAALAADTVTAKKATALRTDKNAMSPKVAEVAKGQVLPVIKKDGKWIFAESNGKQGWAAESWLASEGGGMSKGLGEAGSALSGSAQAGAAGDTAAVKGLEPLTADIARSSGQDARPIQRLIDLRDRVIDSGELAAFGKEGNVGLAKK
jgi:uncharacterized protein YraI